MKILATVIARGCSWIRRAILLGALLGLPPLAVCQQLAHWKLDAAKPGAGGELTVREEVSRSDDTIRGNAWTVKGVVGKALQFDGVTAHIIREGNAAPRIDGAFTLEAWLAIGAYPFNWCPVAQQQSEEGGGFFFGVGDKGQVAFRLMVGGKWQGPETNQFIPLRTWTHVAAVFEPGADASIFINGQLAASERIDGEFTPAPGEDLWIGRNMFQLEQTAPVSPNRQFPTAILFDGILDEITIHQGAKTRADIALDYENSKSAVAPPLDSRTLPTGPDGPVLFGAMYLKLKYYRGWDEYWRSEGLPDVVVSFDEVPVRFVFWRGTSYIPHWVTENGIWYTNEFVESFQKGLQGSAEPMSDKQCRFSSVRIVESNDARVVVHWRYAPVDINYKFAWIDPLTGWGDWADEIHTLYPDGIGVRRITAHSSEPAVAREWHEGIVVMSPGTTPTDALESAAVTLINDKEEAHSYSWEKATPQKYPKFPANAIIQLVNTKSTYRPFTAARLVDSPVFDFYAAEVRRDVNIFPWWNHWPTAFEPSNGRYAQAADRASHSSLTHISWNPCASGRNWMTKILLQGMSDRPAPELAAIARSWHNPPRLRLLAESYEGGDYDQATRAYVLTRKAGSRGTPLTFSLEASDDSPVRNVALVVRNWGEDGANLELDGKLVPRGSHFRYGCRRSPEGTDLVVWIKVERTSRIRISLLPMS